jgi:hypothetical protein
MFDIIFYYEFSNKTYIIQINTKIKLPLEFHYESLIQSAGKETTLPIYKSLSSNTTYEAIAANNFVKLRTERGLQYWCDQAFHNRLLPDWKLHFAIKEEDIGKAWNILAELHIQIGCQYPIKAKMHSAQEWPDHMHGREITIYIPRACSKYNLKKHQIHSSRFWRAYIQEAVKRLEAQSIQPRAIAKGDKPLNKYCSIRNESYIPKLPSMQLPKDWDGYDATLEKSQPSHPQYIYPPNESGFNAAQHPVPKFGR